MDTDRSEESKKVEQLKKEASDEYLKVRNERTKVQEKEKRLEEERKAARDQQSTLSSKHSDDLMRMRSQEMTKLLAASGICFVIGLAVAMFLH